MLIYLLQEFLFYRTGYYTASIFHVSVDYLMGIDKKKTIDVSDLSDEDISVLNHMADTLRKKNKDKKA